jgi:predicted DCC family thiol-disulfide oxidoreductase YuxK
MVPPATQRLPAREGPHLVLYDGVCGFCSRLVRFLLRHDRRRVFRFASLQSQVGRSAVAGVGGDPDELSTLYVTADYQTAASRTFARSDAALFIARTLGWPWRTAQVFRVVPRWIRDRVYDAVARRRYRLFGRADHCLVPDHNLRDRFVE